MSSTLARPLTQSMLHPTARPVALLAPLLTALLLATGCASPPQPAPAVQRQAQALQRGQDALARQDWARAEREFQRARWAAQALDDRDGQARAQLMLAAAAEGAGRPDDALAQLTVLLAQGTALAAPLRLQAHGRAAALCLSQPPRDSCADDHVAAALALCAADCDQWPAVTLLDARRWLLRQQPQRAQGLAQRALDALPAGPVDTPAQRQVQGERANALRLLARAALALGQAAQAHDLGLQALALDRQLGRMAAVVADLDVLARSREAAGDHADAARWQQRAHDAAAALQQLERGE